MKSMTREKIITLFPDIKPLKVIASKEWVRRVRSHYLDSQIIAICEGDYSVKEKTVEECLDSQREFLTPTVKMAKRILNDNTDTKNSDTNSIFVDMVFCRLAYGFQPDEYICFGLEEQTLDERKSWVSDSDRFMYIYSMNDFKDSLIFNNKVETYKRFKNYYGREAIGISKSGDFPVFEHFVRNHPVFVKKQAFEGAGRSIERVDSHKLSVSLQDYFTQLIKQGVHIIEELIQQDQKLAMLNSSSVNTVRCITFNTRNGILIPFAFMKIGRNGSFVDNGRAGGILVGIDENSGRLITDGYDESNICYKNHPDTKVGFNGVKLPDWDQAIAICKEASKMVPTVRCIGWDLAYTDTGWIIVEGNGKTQFIGPQIVFKKGIKKELLEIMRTVDMIVPLQ